MDYARRSSWKVQRTVIYALFIRELKTRFWGRWLGVFWFLLEPLAHVTLLTFLFSFLHHHVLVGIDYTVFLLVGLVPFFLFKNLSVRLMEAIDANRGLFNYRHVKPSDPMLARALLETCLYSAVYLIVLGSLSWIGLHSFPQRPLELIGISALLIVLGGSLGVCFAVVTHDLPQSRPLIRLAFVPLYLISGVIFPVTSLPPEVHPWLLWNPVLHVLELSRVYFFPHYHVLPEISAEYVLGITLIIAALSLSMYRVRRHRLLSG